MVYTIAKQPTTDTANQSGIMTILQPIMTFVQGNLTLVIIGFVAYMMFGPGKKKSKGRVTASRLTKKLYKKVTYQRNKSANKQRPDFVIVPDHQRINPNMKYS